MGIESDDRMNALLKKRFKIEGVAVLNVIPNSAAFDAGLVPAKIYPDGSIIFGDIIIAADGKKINSLEDLEEILDEKSIGDVITLEILREGKKIKKELILK